MRVSIALAVWLPIIGGPAAMSAQAGAVELGIDSGVTVHLSDGADDQTSVCLPCQRFRVGIFASDWFQLEPSVALNVLSRGGETIMAFDGGMSFVLHTSGDPRGPRPFLRVGGTIAVVDLGEGSFAQFGVGGGLGIKAPIGERLAVRLEGVSEYGFESDDVVASFGLGGLIGISFFTR